MLIRKFEEMLRDILDPRRWSVRHAANNLAAFELVKQSAFDLIITSDKTSGPRRCGIAAEDPDGAGAHAVIILADESAPSYVIDSMRERAFSYFSRPFSLTSLAEMVQMAAEGPAWDDGIEVKSATPEWIRILARCDVPTADRLIQFLQEIGDLPEMEEHAVATACREILLNAMEYGGKFQPDQWVEISFVRARHMVMCRVKDPGEGFTLDEIEHAAIANPDEDPIRHVTARDAKGLRPGGYGVLLAKKLVDELDLQRKRE